MARPSKTLISRDAPPRAALGIIDDEGLEALSRAAAKESEVQGPVALVTTSLTKRILAGGPARGAGDAASRRAIGGEMQEWMVEMCVGFRRAILSHPNAATVLLQPQYVPRQFMSRLRAGVPDPGSSIWLPHRAALLILEGLTS